MAKPMKTTFPVALLVIGSLLLGACGGDATPTTGTAPATGATSTTGTGAATGATSTIMTGTTAGPTDTTAAGGAGATTTTGGSTSGSKFDPTTYKKNAIEPNATLRVSSWGDTSEQAINRDALARFNQVYPDVKITYEPQPDNYQTKLLAQITRQHRA